MVYFAALAVVGLMDKGLPMWAAVIGAFVVMILVGMSTERLVLRKLVNQPPITLFMATIGLSFFLEAWGRCCSAMKCARSTWASSTSRSSRS